MSPTPQALQWVCALHRIMCKGLIPEGLLLGALSNKATMLCSLCPVSWHSWLLLHALQVTNDHGLPAWDAGTTTLKQGHYSPHMALATARWECLMRGTLLQAPRLMIPSKSTM